MPRMLRWHETIVNTAALAGGVQTSHDLCATLESSERRQATVTRMILDIWMHPEALTVVHKLYYGVTMLALEQVVAGALPEADGIEESSWLVHGVLYTRSENLSNSSRDDHVRLDIRSQRIFRARTDVLHLVLDNQPNAISYEVFARVLVRTPP